MRIKIFQKIIDKIRNKKSTANSVNYDISSVYGKIYHPIYNLSASFLPKNYRIYNEFGKEIDFFFLRDEIYSHSNIQYCKYFLWDRYDFTLDTHFYSGLQMAETMGNPKRRYAFFPESESIVPHHYAVFDKFKGIEKDFDFIFTFSKDILDRFDNAVFMPFCSGIWNVDEIRDDMHLFKNKNVSILSSNKTMCDLHKYRLNLAIKCQKEGLADAFGTFSGGGGRVKLSDTLKNYRFSICIENDIKPYFFTERLMTAFAFQTIPIYLGASEIDKFFNPDGIIKLKQTDDIEKVLKQCTEKEYERRLPAVLENYNRARKFAYKGCWSTIYENYIHGDDKTKNVRNMWLK